MWSGDVLHHEDSSNSAMYRPEVYKLEQKWRRDRRKEMMATLNPQVEKDSGVGGDSASGVFASVEPSYEAFEDAQHQEPHNKSSFLCPPDRPREMSLRESGFETMEDLVDIEDEPLDLTDERDDDGDLIADVDLPVRVTQPEEDVDDSPTPGQSVLHYYAVSEDPRYFLAVMRPFIMAQDEEGDTCLHHAVIHNRLPALYKLMDVLEDKLWYCVNVQNHLGQTLLHLSTTLKQYGAMRKFVEAEARLDTQDWQGNSPVHIACRKGDLRAMRELLTNVQTREGEVMTYEPEDLNRRNFGGLSPMHLATLAQSTDCIRYLKALGADVNVEDRKRCSTPLHYAVEMQNLGLVTYLVFECGADVNAMTSDGCSSLHLACGYGLDAIVALLVAAGADVSVTNDEGDTPEDIATTTIVRVGQERKMIDASITFPDIVNGFSSMEIKDDTLYNSFDLEE